MYMYIHFCILYTSMTTARTWINIQMPFLQYREKANANAKTFSTSIAIFNFYTFGNTFLEMSYTQVEVHFYTCGNVSYNYRNVKKPHFYVVVALLFLCTVLTCTCTCVHVRVYMYVGSHFIPLEWTTWELTYYPITRTLFKTSFLLSFLLVTFGIRLLEPH